MKIIIVLTLCLLLFSTALYSQTSDQNLPVQTNYSESSVYKPIEFNIKDGKSKKEEKKESVGEIREISVPVSVFKKGNFVNGLQKSNFRVFVDDREIKNFSLEKPDDSLSVIMIFDTSPSTDYKIGQIRNFANSFISQFKDTDKIQIVEFNGEMKVHTDLTGDKELIKKGISHLSFGDGTALYDTINGFFQTEVDKIQGRKALILVTDGVDTTSRKSTYTRSLEQAEKHNIPVYPVYIDTSNANSKALQKTQSLIITDGRIVASRTPIGITQLDYDIGKQYLNDLINLSGGRVGQFKNFADSKKEVLPFLLPEMRQKYYIKFAASESDLTNERKKIKIRIDQPDLFIMARGSYMLDK